MKMREIMETASAGATGAGSVAVATQPMGMVSRSGANLLSGKYTTDPTPNTPREHKRKKNVSRRFENTPGH